MASKKHRQVNARVAPELRRAANRAAKERGQSIAEVIRMALREAATTPLEEKFKRRFSGLPDPSGAAAVLAWMAVTDESADRCHLRQAENLFEDWQRTVCSDDRQGRRNDH